ncbi:unnamed protein product [Sphagnum troendelagicum]
MRLCRTGAFSFSTSWELTADSHEDVFVENSMVDMSLWEHGGCLETELMPILGGCVVHGNGEEALQHFDWISERTHRVKSYQYSLPSVSLQPSRLG